MINVLYNTYDYGYSSSNTALLGMGAAFMFIAFIILIVAIVFYVLSALGMYTMAKNRGLQYAWFAWIPILNNYLLGELTGNEMWGIEGSKWILLFAPFVIGFISLIPVLGPILYVILFIAYIVYFYMIVYRLYVIYAPDRAVLYIILSILFSAIATPIIFFIIRNNRPGPWQQYRG